VAEVKWIKITTDMFDDEKIAIISSMPEANAMLVIWIRLLALAGKTNDGGSIYFDEGIPYTDDMLATIFRQPLNIVRLALATFEKFRMIERHEDQIYICNWEKHQNVEGMDKLREQWRLASSNYRQNKLLGNCHKTSYDGHSTDKNKIRLEEENTNTFSASPSDKKQPDQLEAFNLLLSEYPIKIGESKARQMFFQWQITTEMLVRMHTAITNYKAHLASNDWKKAMNFNTWLECWTDWENYIEELTPEQKDAAIMARLKEPKKCAQK